MTFNDQIRALPNGTAIEIVKKDGERIIGYYARFTEEGEYGTTIDTGHYITKQGIEDPSQEYRVLQTKVEDVAYVLILKRGTSIKNE
ncbi:hypothetical protein HY489_02480 [Candidatus Woesearchaeota archaeon]|nr:hypothetical protein [Candidatus Woesearchaeota archaeon]